jgi:hypothetical protein
MRCSGLFALALLACRDQLTNELRGIPSLENEKRRLPELMVEIRNGFQLEVPPGAALVKIESPRILIRVPSARFGTRVSLESKRPPAMIRKEVELLGPPAAVVARLFNIERVEPAASGHDTFGGIRQHHLDASKRGEEANAVAALRLMRLHVSTHCVD